MTKDQRKRLVLDLQDWGKWSRDDINELSYPSLSVEARMAARASLQRFTGHWALYEPHPRERRLDTIIQSLKTPYKEIIILRYKDQKNWKESKEELNIGRDRYFRELGKAEENIHLCLTLKK